MVAPRDRKKPKKPYPDFPLTPGNNGQWVKRIRGKLHYFGPWHDPDAALEKYRRSAADLHAGREPAVEGATVRDLCNQFHAHKVRQLERGEIVQLTLAHYRRTCDRVVEVFGAGTGLASVKPHDFDRLLASLARTNGPRALAVYVQHVRTLFKYGFEAGLLESPMRFGPGFKRPSAAVIRKLRASKPARLFTAAELRKILAAANPILRAMTLLGINCGFGNADCGWLPKTALDLDAGWVNYPRPKTGIQRRCKLWPETVRALKAALAARPAPLTLLAIPLVFVTRSGGVYNGGRKDSQIGSAFTHLLGKLGLKREGLSFYAVRHTFSTIAEGCRDQVAVGSIMGHVDVTMAQSYREHIDDSRLEAVAKYVRNWLWKKEK
jgi:integrase